MNVEVKTQSYATETPNISEILAQAENVISRKGGRFTTIRKHIFQILAEAPHPLGAYEIIDHLNGVGAQKPPTVYRALNWLIDHGIGVEADDLAFVICKKCGDTDTLEAPSLSKILHQSAKDRGFAETQMVIEIIGLCGGEGSGCTG